MTDRLYYDDPYLQSFEARVTARRTWNDQPAVALDRSAFYPESGGQLGDQGTLNHITVLDTQADDAGEVWHILAQPLDVEQVQGQIDWGRRFDFLQQHHGQHLLSAAFDQVLGARTLSAHLGADSSTIDLEHPPFTTEQSVQVEQLVNHMVWADVEIHARFVTPDELATIPLRKPPQAYERIRIVSAGNFDHSACGGTHPRRTGEVGVVLMRRWEKHKSGTRVEFLCGNRTIRDYAVRRELLSQLATGLHVGLPELPAAVARLQTAHEQQRKTLEELQARLVNYEAHELLQQAAQIAGAAVVARVWSERSMDEVRQLARQIAESGGVALLAVRADKAQFIFSRAAHLPFDMRAALTAATAIVGGRGGGKPDAAQGGGPDVARTDQALQAAVQMLEG